MKSLYLPQSDNCTLEYAKLVRDVEKLKEQQLEEWYEQNNEMSVMEIYDHADHVDRIEKCIDLLYDWIYLDETQLAFKLLQSSQEYQQIKDCIKDIIEYLEHNKDIDMSNKQLKVKEFLWSK